MINRVLASDIQMYSVILYREKMNAIMRALSFNDGDIYFTEEELEQIYRPYGKRK